MAKMPPNGLKTIVCFNVIPMPDIEDKNDSVCSAARVGWRPAQFQVPFNKKNNAWLINLLLNGPKLQLQNILWLC